MVAVVVIKCANIWIYITYVGKFGIPTEESAEGPFPNEWKKRSGSCYDIAYSCAREGPVVKHAEKWQAIYEGMDPSSTY